MSEYMSPRHRFAAGVLAAGLTLSLAQGATAQEQTDTKPTGITDVDYRAECDVETIGDTSKTVDTFYLHNKRGDTVEVELTGEHPASGSVVAIGSLVIGAGESGAKIVEEGVSHINLTEAGTEKGGRVAFECYEAEQDDEEQGEEDDTEEDPDEEPEEEETGDETEESPDEEGQDEEQEDESEKESDEETEEEPADTTEDETNKKTETEEGLKEKSDDTKAKQSAKPVNTAQDKLNTPSKKFKKPSELPRTGENHRSLATSGLLLIISGAFLNHRAKKQPGDIKKYTPRHSFKRP